MTYAKKVSPHFFTTLEKFVRGLQVIIVLATIMVCLTLASPKLLKVSLIR
jgi:hypothetical protein